MHLLGCSNSIPSISDIVTVALMISKPILNRLNDDSPMPFCFNDSNDNSPMLFCVQKFCLQSIQITIVRCSSVCRSSVLNRLKGQWSVALLCANAMSSIDWTTTVRCCNCFDDMDSSEDKLLRPTKRQQWNALLRVKVLSSIDSKDNSPLLFCVPKLCLESTQRTTVRCSFMCQCYVFNRLNDNSPMLQLLRWYGFLTGQRTNCFVWVLSSIDSNDNGPLLFCVPKLCLDSTTTVRWCNCFDASNWGKFSLNSEFCFGWQQKAYPE